jgi:hypothetical protein
MVVTTVQGRAIQASNLSKLLAAPLQRGALIVLVPAQINSYISCKNKPFNGF